MATAFWGQRALICSEAWYRLLRYGHGAGYLASAVLLRKRGCRKALLALLATTLWRYLFSKESRRLMLLPDIRPQCLAAAKQALMAEKINVMDGFSQTVARFLFRPGAGYGEDGEVIVVETMLQDGSREARSNLKKNKGIFGFAYAQDLDGGLEPEEPYSFHRDDGSTAVVRMWCVNLAGLEEAFELLEVRAASDLKAAGEQAAYQDFRRALIGGLSGTERVAQGSFWMCMQQKTIINNFLAVEGCLEDLVEALKRHPLIMRHYFRLEVREEKGKVAFRANLGFGQKCLDLFPTSTSRCVLYIRQGGHTHACTQGSREFVLDQRTNSTLNLTS